MKQFIEFRKWHPQDEKQMIAIAFEEITAIEQINDSELNVFVLDNGFHVYDNYNEVLKIIREVLQ